MTPLSTRVVRLAVAVSLCLITGLGGGFDRPRPVKAQQPWKTGYWLWGQHPATLADARAEILYVELAGRRWPHDLPDAAQYIVVYRIEPTDPITDAAAAAVGANYRAVIADAGHTVPIGGVQIDYDCPTRRLAEYGAFLRRVREELPAGSVLSITGLLDWFAPHTAIAAAPEPVDEFVPQFYDNVSVRTSSGIATPIDPVKWARVFNAYRTPYRIGISSFGRIARRRTDATGRSTIQYFRDASPFDFSDRPEFTKSAGLSVAGELIVHYDVAASTTERPDLASGDEVDITVPTETSVRAAYESARRFGGYCAGIIFFRWPNRGETLVLAPDDVERVVSGHSLAAATTLDVHTARCLERHCADIYLDLGGAVAAVDRAVAIHAVGKVDVFLPGGPLHARQVGTSLIAIQIPAYSGWGEVYLGRAISATPVQFEVIRP